MRTKRQLFSINVDFHHLGEDFIKNGINNTESFSIIETFIETSAENNGLFQLLSITKHGVESPENHQNFSKALFKITDDHRLDQVTTRDYIDRLEYYNKLLNSYTESVEHKMRLTFRHQKARFSIECLESTKFTALQIEFPVDENNNPLIDLDLILSDFPSIKVIEKLDLSLEEVFYRHHLEQTAVA